MLTQPVCASRATWEEKEFLRAAISSCLFQFSNCPFASAPSISEVPVPRVALCLPLLQKSPDPRSNPCCVRLSPGSWWWHLSKWRLHVLPWLTGHAGGCWGTIWRYLGKFTALEEFIVEERRRVTGRRVPAAGASCVLRKHVKWAAERCVGSEGEGRLGEAWGLWLEATGGRACQCGGRVMTRGLGVTWPSPFLGPHRRPPSGVLAYGCRVRLGSERLHQAPLQILSFLPGSGPSADASSVLGCNPAAPARQGPFRDCFCP